MHIEITQTLGPNLNTFFIENLEVFIMFKLSESILLLLLFLL